MISKPFYRMLFIVFLLVLLTGCAKLPQGSGSATRTSVPSLEPKVVATSTVQSIEITVVPTPTEEVTSVTETGNTDSCTKTSNPCECLGKSYEYNQELGEIKEDYVGSWHAAPSVGSGYAERFVFFSTGNYLFFPSQYECDFSDNTCTPSPVEEGTWGVQGDQINLSRDGDINNVRSIYIGKVIDSSPDESPYPLKTTFEGTTYWLMSKDTDMWNPETGESCD